MAISNHQNTGKENGSCLICEPFQLYTYDILWLYIPKNHETRLTHFFPFRLPPSSDRLILETGHHWGSLGTKSSAASWVQSFSCWRKSSWRIQQKLWRMPVYQELGVSHDVTQGYRDHSGDMWNLGNGESCLVLWVWVWYWRWPRFMGCQRLELNAFRRLSVVCVTLSRLCVP